MSGPISNEPTPPRTPPLAATPPAGAQPVQSQGSGRSPLAQFLGASATPQDVTKFLEGFLKFFNVIIQQSDAAARRGEEALKKANEDNS